MPESKIANLVEVTKKTGFVENAMQLLWGIGLASDPAQHFCRRISTILAVLVSIVGLIIVIGNPFPMGGKHSAPGSILGKIPVRKPSHQIELRLNQILPGLSLLNLHFLNGERLVDPH